MSLISSILTYLAYLQSCGHVTDTMEQLGFRTATDMPGVITEVSSLSTVLLCTFIILSLFMYLPVIP